MLHHGASIQLRKAITQLSGGPRLRLQQVEDSPPAPISESLEYAWRSRGGIRCRRLDEGTTAIWRFADFPGERPVHLKKVVPNQLIVFEWEAERK